MSCLSDRARITFSLVKNEYQFTKRKRLSQVFNIHECFEPARGASNRPVKPGAPLPPPPLNHSEPPHRTGAQLLINSHIRKLPETLDTLKIWRGKLGRCGPVLKGGSVLWRGSAVRRQRFIELFRYLEHVMKFNITKVCTIAE